MPVSRERMEQYQNRHMKQIEHAARQWDARESKIKNNNLRRQWMERQTNANYRNEYDRIRGELRTGEDPASNNRRTKGTGSGTQTLIFFC